MEKETLLSILEENMSFQVPSGFKKATANLLVTVGEKEKSVMRRSVQQLMNLQERAAGIMFPGLDMVCRWRIRRFFTGWFNAGWQTERSPMRLYVFRLNSSANLDRDI